MTGIAGLGNGSPCAERPDTDVGAITARGGAWSPACLHAAGPAGHLARAHALAAPSLRRHCRDGPRRIGWIVNQAAVRWRARNPACCLIVDPGRAVPCV